MRCAGCGAGFEPGAGFCTNCGRQLEVGGEAGSGTEPSAATERRGSALSLLLGVGALALLLGTGWLALDRANGPESQQAGDASPGGTVAGGDADVDLASQDGEGGPTDAGSGVTTADSVPTSVPTTVGSSIPTTTALFASRDVVYGRFVAVLWSDFVAPSSSASIDPLLEAELRSYQDRFGPSVIAVDSNQSRSLRDGTAAVVYDGGFTSARDAKRWCRDSGFPGIQDCFGVVLSDDFTPDQRGEFIRAYEL